MRIVDTARKGGLEPVDHRCAFRLGDRVRGLVWIVIDDDIFTPTGERPTDGGRETASTTDGLEVGPCRPSFGDPDQWKSRPLPGRRQHRQAIQRQLLRERFGIGDRHNPLTRIMTQNPGWKRNRGGVGFDGSRRHGDDQPCDLAACHLLTRIGNRLDAPIVLIPTARIDAAAWPICRSSWVRALRGLARIASGAICSIRNPSPVKKAPQFREPVCCFPFNRSGNSCLRAAGTHNNPPYPRPGLLQRLAKARMVRLVEGGRSVGHRGPPADRSSRPSIAIPVRARG